MPPFVLIVDPDPLWREGVVSRLRASMPTSSVSWLPDALDPARDVKPGILVVGPNAYVSIEDELAPALREHPNLPVLLVVRQMEVDTLRVALHAGVRDVYPKTTSAEELAQAVMNLASQAPQTGSGAASPGLPPPPSGGGKIVAVCSAKGGTGVTTLATSMALTLSGSGNRRVALADADPVFGDVPLLLGLPAPPMIDDNGLPDSMPVDELAKQLLTYKSTGLQVYCVRRSNMALSQIPERLVLETLAALQTLSDVVVVDTPAPISQTAGLLIHADELFIVSHADRASLKNVIVAYQLLHDAGLPPGRTRLVINKLRSGVDIEPESFEQIVGLPVVGVIPDSGAVPAAVDAGEAFVRASSRDAAARVMQQISNELAARIGV